VGGVGVGGAVRGCGGGVLGFRRGRRVGRGRLGVFLWRRRWLGHRVGVPAGFGAAGRQAARGGRLRGGGRGSRLGRLRLPVGGGRPRALPGGVGDRELGADGDRLVPPRRGPAPGARSRGGGFRV